MKNALLRSLSIVLMIFVFAACSDDDSGTNGNNDDNGGTNPTKSSKIVYTSELSVPPLIYTMNDDGTDKKN